MRDWIFALLLLVAVVLIVCGVAGWSVSASLVVAGVLLAGWAWLVIVFGEAGADSEPATATTEDA